MDKMKRIFALALTLALTAAAAGCGKEIGTEEPVPKAEQEATAEEDVVTEAEPESVAETTTTTAAATTTAAETEPELPKIGLEDAASADYSVELTNGTEKEITGIYISYGDSGYSENLLPEGENFAVDEKRLFSWSAPDDGGMVISDYNLEIDFGSDSFVLHGFPLTDMLSGEIRLMDEYAFLVYANRVGDTKDTMEKESKIAEEERRAEEEKTATATTTTTAYEETEPVTETEVPAQTEAPADNGWGEVYY